MDTSSSSSTDWTLCIFCQTSTDEKLSCPFLAKNKQQACAGYKTLEVDLQSFSEIGQLLDSHLLTRLDDGSGISSSLENHKAKWHKSCRDQYNKTKLGRLLKRKSLEDIDASASTSTADIKSKRKLGNKSDERNCFFCDMGEKEGDLHRASTFNLDLKVRSALLKVNETRLLAKLSTGDAVAIDMDYHTKCLMSLYNRARAVDNQKSENESQNDTLCSIAFAELTTFIEEELNETDSPVLKLAELVHMYRVRLKQLGVLHEERIHSTRLKEKLLLYIPGLKAYSKGRDVLLVRDADIGKLLSKAAEEHNDTDALCLAKAANIVRRDMFNNNLFTFKSSFTPNCQEMSVPPLLMAFVRMLLEGPNVVTQTETPTRPEALSIAQLIRHNSVKFKRRKPTSSVMRHDLSHETPLPLYVGMLVHSYTRKKGLIDHLFELGLCADYKRVIQISTDLANAMCTRFNEAQVVVPSNLKIGVFTTAAVDNIDHNPSSTTAKGSFHGTGISLFQHPDFDGQGSDVDHITITPSNSTHVSTLPNFYANVPPVSMPPKDTPVPAPVITADNLTMDTEQHTKDEYEWLEHVRQVNMHNVTEQDNVSWSAYYADRQTSVRPKCTSALLPLFEDSAHSVAMIRHSMTLVKNAVNHLNSGQVPIIACDQPLYAIAKNIQWTWPEEFGEDRFIVLFGALHIEMAAWKAVGTWVEGSGWTDVITQANIATAGKADSFLNVAHLTRTRHAHQVTAASLYILQHQAYDTYVTGLDETTEKLEFDAWCETMAKNHPQFGYWAIVLELELTVLAFVRSLRSSNFEMYIATLIKLMPWFFALNHPHYSRWLSVHIRDMQELSTKHPEVARQFEAGKFTFQKTKRAFSAMPLDQTHEQANELVKGDGGAIGLTENPQALRKWMIGGPEVTRLLQEFEDTMPNAESEPEMTKHHEQSPSMQDRFKNHVKATVQTIKDHGNPFTDEGNDIVSLVTKDIPDPSVVETVKNVKATGEKQYQAFVKERLIDRSKPLKDTIPKNKIALFKDRPRKSSSSSTTLKLKSSKTDCQLFSRLYIGCQNRGSNLDEFFSHENQACPPSVSDGGRLRQGSKSKLLECFEDLHSTTPDEPPVSAVIIDGAAVVQMLKPRAAKTFVDYSKEVFVPYIQQWLQKVERVDLVWDVYQKNSLKSATRERRGVGSRRRVELTVALPRNWQGFLQVDENKTELFHLLSEQVTQIHIDGTKQIVSTHGDGILSTPVLEDSSQLSPCTHEEADTRMFVHCVDAVNKGHNQIMIRTVDTDVVVLAIALYHNLHVDKLWIAFGTGNNFRYLPAHQYALALGPERSSALSLFHAITGCDTVSFFGGRGKKTAWDVWAAYGNVCDRAFLQISRSPSDISAESLNVLERFVVLLYDRTSELYKVDAARKHLFTKKGRSIDSIPPTQAALFQHIWRAVYQGCYVWGQSLIPRPTLPDPTKWGWKLENSRYHPLWTTKPEASLTCRELIRCGCTRGCTNRCKCNRAELQCTALCACDGQCTD